MRELTSVWAPHLLAFYESKKLSGFKYNSAESVISQFDDYYNSLGITELKLSRDIIEPFLYLKENSRIGTQSWKASVLRQFGYFILDYGVLDHVYLIPSISLKGEAEFAPHIYTQKELQGIIEFLENYTQMDIPGGFNICTNTVNAVVTVFKILISTGMRIGEVLALKRKDVDLDNDLFIIKEAKNNNQRLVPFSWTLHKVITDYIAETPFNLPYEDLLFQIETQRYLDHHACSRYFYKAIKVVGISERARIHDFRHTYAVMALRKLQKEDENVNLSLSYLSNYLGHKSLKETQKYIWMTPELFEDVKMKMSDYSRFIYDIYNEGKADEEE